MTLAVTSLTSNATAGASIGGFTTASVSPAANSLLVLWVSGFDGAGSQDFTVNTVTGLGLTWTRQHLGVAGSTPKGDVEAWTAVCGASPGSGAITVAMTASNINGGLAWDLDQVTGQNASTPVVTGNTVFSNNSSAASSVTFAAAGSSQNLFLFGSTVLIGTGQSVTQAPSETPAWTSLAANTQSNTTSQNGVSLSTQVSPDVTHLTASSSWTGSHSWGTIGLEIAAASGTAHTATASLTVTPSFSAQRTAARFRTGALSVVPSFSAGRTRGKFRSGSLTVLPSFSASRVHGHSRTASLLVSPSFQAQRSVAHVRHGSLLVPVSFLAVPSGGAAPVVQRGSWWGLVSVLRHDQQEFDAYRSMVPLACPVDGEPLKPPPNTPAGATTERYCPFCGWRYPRDYVAPSRPSSGRPGVMA